MLGDQGGTSTCAWPQQLCPHLCPCLQGELHPSRQHRAPGWMTSVRFTACLLIKMGDFMLPTCNWVYNLAKKLKKKKKTNPKHVITKCYSTCISASLQSPAESQLSSVIFLCICQVLRGKNHLWCLTGAFPGHSFQRVTKN